MKLFGPGHFILSSNRGYEKSIPWENIAISGWVVNPDRSKMSKSKGNTVTPDDLLDTYSTDAIRYWASKAKLGQDTIFDENVFHVGQKCVVKLFNASKFVLMQTQDQPHDLTTWLSPNRVSESIDRAWIKKCEQLVEEASCAFKAYDYTQALLATENLFWDFCDNYLELVKTRAYQQKTHQQVNLQSPRCYCLYACYCVYSRRSCHLLPKRFGLGVLGYTVTSRPCIRRHGHIKMNLMQSVTTSH